MVVYDRLTALYSYVDRVPYGHYERDLDVFVIGQSMVAISTEVINLIKTSNLMWHYAPHRTDNYIGIHSYSSLYSNLLKYITFIA